MSTTKIPVELVDPTGSTNGQALVSGGPTQIPAWGNVVNSADLANTTDPTKGSALVGYLLDAAGAVGRKLSSKLGEVISVGDFGADPTGVKDSTADLQDALTALSNAGGGILTLIGNIKTSPFTIPNNVTLRGNMRGPFSSINSTNIQNYPVLIVNDVASTFITMGAQDSHLEDIAIYYPQQVAPTASTPNVYPASVTSPKANNGGNGVERCTFINAYQGVTGAFARGRICDNIFGCFYNDTTIDYTEDWSFLNNNISTSYWDIFAGLSAPQTIDTWVAANRNCHQIFRCDGLYAAANKGLSVNALYFLGDSPDATQNPTCGYGEIKGMDADTVNYGIIAKASNPAGGGFVVSGMIDASQNPILFQTGGSLYPLVTWEAGVNRGVAPILPAVGFLDIKKVFGVNNSYNPSHTQPPLSAPSVPASLTFITNPFPYSVRVYAYGSISNMYINGVEISSSAGSLILNSGDQIALNYTGTPTWVWFAV